MRTSEVRSIPSLTDLPVFDSDDLRGAELTAIDQMASMTEAVDPARLQELLHRSVHRPVAANRSRQAESDCAEVHFDRVDEFNPPQELPS